MEPRRRFSPSGHSGFIAPPGRPHITCSTSDGNAARNFGWIVLRRVRVARFPDLADVLRSGRDFDAADQRRLLLKTRSPPAPAQSGVHSGLWRMPTANRTEEAHELVTAAQAHRMATDGQSDVIDRRSDPSIRPLQDNAPPCGGALASGGENRD